MGKLILITGGARSGKSIHAEKLAREFGDKVLYVATSIPFDDEMRDRVKKHRQQRPAAWKTLEAYKNLDHAILSEARGCDAVLVDCITIMVTNLMLEEEMDWDHVDMEQVNRLEDKIREEAGKLAFVKKKFSGTVILVTNELGMGLVPEYAMGRAFRDIAGRVNQFLAAEADEVYFCVSGIPMKIKGEKRRPG